MDEAPDQGQQSALAGLGTHRLERTPGIGDPEEVEEQRELLEKVNVDRPQALRNPLPRHLVRVALNDPEEGAQHLENSQERHRARVGVGAGLDDRHPALAATSRELSADTALADAGFPHQAYRLSLAGERQFHNLLQMLELPLAPHERGQPAEAGDIERAACRPHPPQSEDPERLARPLHLLLAEVAKIEVARDEPGSVLSQVDGAGLRRRFHPLPEADRVTERGVIEAEVVTDRPHHDLARVEAETQPEVDLVLCLEPARELGDGVADRQRRVAGAPGVVFVGDRGAEQRHRAVAGERVDLALKAVDLLGDQREKAIDHREPALRTEALRDAHRTDDVTEEHRDQLSLTLQRRRFGADPGRQVPGHIRARLASGFGRGDPTTPSRRELGRAHVAVALADGIPLAAARTIDGLADPRRALAAKRRARGIGVAASRAVHPVTVALGGRLDRSS